ncbi:MAG: biotin--[acetyl-CoA-carboxylase] ligase [Desulfamplus sp.]|nr:biotin--[acetyl-CoA-carboxylase] ligase [Desulfamplus sp.]
MKIYFFSTLSNTMDKARELARNNAPHFSVVVAEEQTKGRGRLNRMWLSDKGGLWFTVILRPIFPPTLAFQINFAASLSVAKILKHKYGLDVSVKWPNDIIVKCKETKNNRDILNNKKVAGLLSEMETYGDKISFINIGIGINVNNNPETEQLNATSIKTILNRDMQYIDQDICKIDLLNSFLDEFEKHILAIESGSINCINLIEEWKQMTSTIGKRVRIETFNGFYEGIAIDVEQNGALLIRDDSGIKKSIIYGDCFYQ